MPISLNPDDTPVRADVPVSLHPDSLGNLAKALDVEATVGRNALSDARSALAAAYAAVSNLNDAERALQEAAPPAKVRQRPAGGKGRPMVETEGNVRMGRDGQPYRHVENQELVRAAERALIRTTRLIDARYASLKNHIEALETRVGEALRDPVVTTPVAGEIRSHVKGLGKNRMGFLNKAVTAGDRGTVAAVLSAPAYLSGLSEREYATLREMAAQQFAPTDHAQLGAAREALEQVASAGSQVVGRYTKVMQAANSPAAQAAKKVAELGEGEK